MPLQSRNFSVHGDLKVRKFKTNINAPISWKIKNLPNLLRGAREGFADILGGNTRLTAKLYIKHIKADGQTVNYGLVSNRVVTTAFVQFMVDQLQTETSEWGDFKFHDAGTDNTAEAIGDTGVISTSGYGRATGSQTEGASANIYRSVGTLNFTGTLSLVEHALMSQGSGGTCMDRSVYSQINVGDGDSVEYTYELTCDDGG